VNSTQGWSEDGEELDIAARRAFLGSSSNVDLLGPWYYSGREGGDDDCDLEYDRLFHPAKCVILSSAVKLGEGKGIIKNHETMAGNFFAGGYGCTSTIWNPLPEGHYRSVMVGQ